MGTDGFLLQPLRKPPIEVAALGSSPLTHLAGLPKEPGIYLALDNANRVWYVGLAEAIRDRLVGHDRMPDFKDHAVTKIGWKCEDSPTKRRSLEKELIEFFHPPLNSQHNFNQLPATNLGLSPGEEIERYFRLRIQQKLIELELELLKPNIVSRCEQFSGDKIIHRFGTIQPQCYKSWQFSSEVEKIKEDLKLAQKAEKESGAATVKAITVSPVVRLNAAALADEVTIWVSQIERDQDSEESPEAA